jgi:dipeptidase D
MLNIPEYKDAEKVFYFFEEISKIPHPSEHTEKIADYLVGFAKARGLWYKRDESNNVIIRKPATKGYENRPTVIFQGHTDMVADKIIGAEIDMYKEGLKLFRDGDFIRAEGTTLGGDDGVAIAYSLAILDSDDIEHPEFEALFTSDEEIGLIGATALDTSVLHGKTMINIDSDGEGIFTVGCAGGIRMDATLPFVRCETEENLYRLSVSGLMGGHSGTEIDKGRINAIKVLAEVMENAEDAEIAQISGGNADNAIPRYADCIFTSESTDLIKDSAIPTVTEKYKDKEPDIEIKIEAISGSNECFSKNDSSKILEFIKKTPTGVYKMSDDIPGLVETSSNLGIIESSGDRVTLSLSLRSAKNEEKTRLRAYVNELGKEFGADVSERGEYPAWEYKKTSHLRDVMRKVYVDEYGKEPEIITIHAGLECGIFSNKISGLDCVSIGPDNFDIHTPEERLSISSTARVWDYLKKVLKEI